MLCLSLTRSVLSVTCRYNPEFIYLPVSSSSILQSIGPSPTLSSSWTQPEGRTQPEGHTGAPPTGHHSAARELFTFNRQCLLCYMYQGALSESLVLLFATPTVPYQIEHWLYRTCERGVSTNICCSNVPKISFACASAFLCLNRCAGAGRKPYGKHCIQLCLVYIRK